MTHTFFSGEAEDRNEIHNIAKCLAELTFSWANSDQTRIEPVLEQMLKDSEHSEHEKVKQFSLLTLGELGRRVSLGPKVVQQQISQFKVKFNLTLPFLSEAISRRNRKISKYQQQLVWG